MDDATSSVRVIEAGSVAPPAVGPVAVPAKILVAVHGVGDQSQYATIQAVAHGFCQYFGKKATIPLGRFHSGVAGPYVIEKDSVLGDAIGGSVGFAEIYWADIPREVVAKKYMLEEAQGWARALVESIRMHHLDLQRRSSNGPDAARISITDSEFAMIETVIGELIQSVDVVDRLLVVARKAGIFSFELKTLLADFLGDVQIVTEFESERKKLLKQFREGMEVIYQSNHDAEIYIVAHSEGTVLTLLGLLEGLVADPVPPWIGRIRGLMTIGSPLNKHVVCWPDLWKKYQGMNDSKGNSRGLPGYGGRPPIVWHNYADTADPIGFRLDHTRRWLEAEGWGRAFEFPAENDHKFTRYLLPGKAHTDYWADGDVFGHFIQAVVKPGRAGSRTFDRPPADRWLATAVSVLIYLIPFLLLFVGVYFFYKGVHSAVGQDDPLTGRQILMDVLALTGLHAGITVVARIPRLCRRPLLQLGAFLLLLVSMAFFGRVATPHLRMAFGSVMLETVQGWANRVPYLKSHLDVKPHAYFAYYHPDRPEEVFVEGEKGKVLSSARIEPTLRLVEGGKDGATRFMPGGTTKDGYRQIMAYRPSRLEIDRPTFAYLTLAFVLAVANYFLCRAFPQVGMTGLIGAGAVLSFALVANYMWSAREDEGVGPFWPVILAGVAYFYLWWLAAMVFDLIFVWRRYIRNAETVGEVLPITPRPKR